MSDPTRKKVLILTYYWPPSGGAGVQRWLKFTKYLRDFGYEPLIYTALDPEYPSLDESLCDDIPEDLTVLRTKVWEPYKLYKWFTFQKKGHRVNTGFLNKDKKGGPAERVSVWIRGNWFIPDARKFWIKPSIRYLTNYLKDHPVSLLVSTGPPHSMHLIALGIKEKLNLPWIADFRDPWTKIDFYRELRAGPRANRRHHRLESAVLNSADAVTVISVDMKRQFEGMGFVNLTVITNGFDPDDFRDLSADSAPDDLSSTGQVQSGEGQSAERHSGNLRPGDSLDREFSLTHIGTLVPSRNPEILWDVLSELAAENGDFRRDLKIRLIGALDYSVQGSLGKAGLTDLTQQIGYLSHRDAVAAERSSQVLLLLINRTPNARGILTGKLFEYLCSGRPILAIGPPDGDAASILRQTGTGQIVDFDDRDNLKKIILEFYGLYKKGELKLQTGNIEEYSRKTLTRKMTDLFTEILSRK